MIQRQTKELQTAVEKKRIEMDTKYETKVDHLAILLGRREVYRKAIQQLHTHKRQLEKFRKTVKVSHACPGFFFMRIMHTGKGVGADSTRADDLPRFCKSVQRRRSQFAIRICVLLCVCFPGKKVSNCVFVIVRQFPEGPQYSYVDTFALETSTDAVYFREAFLLLIKRTELFADVNTVYLVGDNG